MREKLLQNELKEQIDSYNTSLFDFKKEKWEYYKEKIMEIEQEVFGDKGYNEQRLKELFEGRDNIIITLNGEDSILGYLSAVPMGKEKIFITSVAIRKDFQGKGLIKKIMKSLEDEANHRNYKFVKGFFNVNNGFADKIEKNYEVIESEFYDNPTLGKQKIITFKILNSNKLKENPDN